MAVISLLLTTLVAFGTTALALTVPVSSDVTTYYKNMSDISVKLNTDAVVKSFTAPDLDTSAIKSLQIEPRSEAGLSRRFTVTRFDCLSPLPAHRPILEDCSRLCDYLGHVQGPILIRPLNIWYEQSGHCILGIVNTNPCHPLVIDPIRILQGYCRSMLTDCVRNGFDGFIEGVAPGMAMALTGLEAAPPYTREPC